MSHRKEKFFGVVLAGGRSRRFGRPKVLAQVGDRPLGSWSVRALEGAGLPVGVVSAEEGVGEVLGVPSRPDLQPGLGPLGGLWTALDWARERGDDGVFLLACDMPLVTDGVVRLLLGRPDGASAVVPFGPDGVEPLCALYRLSCIAAVEKRVTSGDLSLHGLLHGVDAALVDRGLLAGVVDPNTCFLNVNTVADVAKAEKILSALTETEP